MRKSTRRNGRAGTVDASEQPLTPEQIAHYRAQLKRGRAYIDELLSEPSNTALLASKLTSGKAGGRTQFIAEREKHLGAME